MTKDTSRRVMEPADHAPTGRLMWAFAWFVAALIVLGGLL